MRKKILLLPLLILVSLTSWAGGLELKLVFPRATMLPGEPLNFKATFVNTTDAPIGISLITWQVPMTFAVSSAGKESVLDTVNYWKFPSGKTVGLFGEIQVPAHGSFDFLQVNYHPALSFMEPGAYRVRLVYKSPGKVYAHVPPRPGEKEPPFGCGGCWAGEITSNEVTITVETPSGEDAKAYEKYFAPAPVDWDKYRQPSRFERRPPTVERYPDFVAEFPSSTYAAWVRLWRFDSGTQWWFRPFTIMSETDIYLNATREEYARRPHPNISEDEQLPSLVCEARDILKQWPNLEPVASIVRVDLASLLYISGDTAGAKEQLDIVAKARPDWEEGRIAKRMLDVVATAPPATSQQSGPKDTRTSNKAPIR